MTEPGNSQIAIEETDSVKTTAKLTIDHGSAANPGLRFTYTGPPRWYDLAVVLVFLMGIGFIAISLFYTFDSLPYRWEGLLFLLVAAVFIDNGWSGFKGRGRKTETLRYSVKVEDGCACFSDGSYQQTFDLSKLGRLWIATRRKNGSLFEASIDAYYNGDTVTVLNILDLYPRLGSQSHVVLEHIVTYLNKNAVDIHKRRKAMQDHTPFVPIQAGYRADYAADTPLAARNIRPLADKRKRLAIASGIGLLAYLIYQSPLFSLEQDYYPALVTLTAMFGIPLLYSKAVDLVAACTCRKGNGFWCSLVIIICSLALSYILFLLVDKRGFILPPIAIALIFIPPTIWLLYRSFSGCSCGANKVRQPPVRAGKKKRKR